MISKRIRGEKELARHSIIKGDTVSLAVNDSHSVSPWFEVTHRNDDGEHIMVWISACVPVEHVEFVYRNIEDAR